MFETLDLSGVARYKSPAASLAVDLSKYDAFRHIEQRLLSDTLDANGAVTISLCRLEALHRLGRESLADKISRTEFARVLECFNHDVFLPFTIESMGVSLADDEGVPATALGTKIDALSPIERYALADLIEQSYHAFGAGKCPYDFAEKMGLRFAPD